MKHKKVVSFARRMRKEPTVAEKFFWYKVRNRSFDGHKFLRQYVISYDKPLKQKAYFIADFYCAKAKLIVEIDGKYHLNQQAYDQRREEILRGMAFRVIRFTNEEVLSDWEKVETVLHSHLE
ncbi:MAG: endonuclease domain-containing protein [Bacteroidota bacterium]